MSLEYHQADWDARRPMVAACARRRADSRSTDGRVVGAGNATGGRGTQFSIITPAPATAVASDPLRGERVNDANPIVMSELTETIKRYGLAKLNLMAFRTASSFLPPMNGVLFSSSEPAVPWHCLLAPVRPRKEKKRREGMQLVVCLFSSTHSVTILRAASPFFGKFSEMSVPCTENRSVCRFHNCGGAESPCQRV